jgi:hypothetical protein
MRITEELLEGKSSGSSLLRSITARSTISTVHLHTHFVHGWQYIRKLHCMFRWTGKSLYSEKNEQGLFPKKLD